MTKRNKISIGKKFGKLTVIERVGKHHKRGIIWKCKCECGNYKNVINHNLTNNRTKSCGCLKDKVGKHAASFSGIEQIYGTYISKIKRRAKKKKQEYTVTKEYLWDLFIKQDRKCSITNIDLYFRSRYDKPDGNASLDRIDSSKGYIEGNVQWIHKDVQNMKMDMLLEELVKYCRMVVDYYVKS